MMGKGVTLEEGTRRSKMEDLSNPAGKEEALKRWEIVVSITLR